MKVLRWGCLGSAVAAPRSLGRGPAGSRRRYAAFVEHPKPKELLPVLRAVARLGNAEQDAVAAEVRGRLRRAGS